MRSLWFLPALAAIVAAVIAAMAAQAAADPLATVRPGDVFVVRPPPTRSEAQEVTFGGRGYSPLTVPGERGPVFLVGIDLGAEPGTFPLIVRRADGGEEHRTVRVERRIFPEERLALPEAMVTPPKEFEERIAREQAQAVEIYRSPTREKLWDRGFTPPLAQKPAGNFGRRRILNGIPKSPHTGQDYTAPAGTPVKAIAGGVVRLAADFYYSGLTVFIDHGSGLISVAMHLERIFVEQGQTLSAGQVIGRVGSTGRATGPHLHLSIRLFDQRVDPESLWGLFKHSEGR